jgi:uncharacterized protein (TIGR03000 family)
MKRTIFSVGVAFFGCVVVLALPNSAEAQIFRRGFVRGPVVRPGPIYRPGFNPNRMPGWDWWRTYPWSPYNYGRNPYNPAWYPYPAYYTQPYPVYIPSGPTMYTGSATYSDSAYPGDGTMYPSSQGEPVLLPHPSGAVRYPPPDGAIIRVRVPDANAKVKFDGVNTYTEGTQRYYVTPSLPAGKEHSYTLTASWDRDGQPVTRERQIKVAPGQTTVVDFTAPAAE